MRAARATATATSMPVTPTAGVATIGSTRCRSSTGVAWWCSSARASRGQQVGHLLDGRERPEPGGHRVEDWWHETLVRLLLA